jgi:V/A-type H+-transporting ATPase subunit A
VQEYLAEKISPDWVRKIFELKDMLLRGKESYDQINILGDDSVPIEYHDIFWKSEVIDFIILQQDAFDEIDKATPMDRQKYMLELVYKICNTSFNFKNFEEIQGYYKALINLLKQMNYSKFKESNFNNYESELKKLINEKSGDRNEQ